MTDRRRFLNRLGQLEDAWERWDRESARDPARESFSAKVERAAARMDPRTRAVGRAAIEGRFHNHNCFVAYVRDGLADHKKLDHSWHPPGMSLIMLLAASLPVETPDG